MRLKSIIDTPCGFRFLFEKLNLKSSVARNVLMESSMLQSAKEITNYYRELEEFYKIFVSEGRFTNTLLSIQTKLSLLRDIRGTISRLEDEAVLDDIELFEIKGLSLLYEDIRTLFEGTFIKSVCFDDLSSIVKLLDPEGHKITSFYIYDCYSEELKELRIQIRKEVKYNNELNYKTSIIEDGIRKELSNKLVPFTLVLRNAISSLSKIDILIAKSLQIKELDLCIPVLGKERTSYRSLFNPEVKDIISKEGRLFQNVDISFEPSEPLLITGANMGGKTVVLKTLALSQYLFQFGFGIPSKEAEIASVSEIHFCIGDQQSISTGLSSFAAEMQRIDRVIKSVRGGKEIIALIDEPARTTNPTEGTALVKALIKILAGKHFRMVLTSHYNIDSVSCKRLRVKGYENGAMNYSLIEDSNTQAPQEALQIARAIGIDNEWIEEAEALVDKVNYNKN